MSLSGVEDAIWWLWKPWEVFWRQEWWFCFLSQIAKVSQRFPGLHSGLMECVVKLLENQVYDEFCGFSIGLLQRYAKLLLTNLEELENYLSVPAAKTSHRLSVINPAASAHRGEAFTHLFLGRPRFVWLAQLVFRISINTF